MKDYIEQISAITDFESKVMFLKGLIDRIRPRKLRDVKMAEDRIRELTLLLTDERVAAALSKLFTDIIEEADFTDFFMESGIPSKSGFFAEIASRIRHKFLAPLVSDVSLQYVFGKVFHKQSDYIWVGEVADETWQGLFSRIRIGFDPINEKLNHQIMNALTVLSYRIAFYGSDIQITRRMDKDTDLQTCFLEQNKELMLFMESLKKGAYDHHSLRHAAVMLNQCQESLDTIKKKSAQFGTSLNQNFLLRMLQQLIRRTLILTNFMDNSTEINSDKLVLFFKQSVLQENTQNDIVRFISSTLSVLSYQIAEHKGRTGEHYITTTRADYFKFFWSSCGGGTIVSFLVILKVLLHRAGMAPFWEALSFSLNYAIGFVLIQITGSTLATKQPAMTASTIASSMDTRKEGSVSLFQLAVMVARVCRSQTISFAGNLLLVFPLALLWVFLFDHLTGHSLVNQEQASHMLQDIHPFRSLSLLYATLTGVFLFLSSVMSGYVDNKMLYSRIGDRLRRKLSPDQPLKPRKLNRIITYLEGHAGSLAGNIFLGFLLGTAGLVVHIFALPYDVRHITFSTGNMAVGLYELGFGIGLKQIAILVAGIAGIGLINFLASFAFAFYVAVKSRNIDIRQYPRFYFILFRYWLKRPLHFIFPPKNEPEESLLGGPKEEIPVDTSVGH